MQSALSKWLGSPLTRPTGSLIEELLIRSLSCRGNTPKIYHLLQETLRDPLLKVKKHWTGDQAVEISPEEVMFE